MRLPKYVVPMLREAARRGFTGPGIYHINVQHDDWCDLLRARGPCNCDPEIGPIWAEPAGHDQAH